MPWCSPISSLSSRCRINHQAAPLPHPFRSRSTQQQGRNLQDYSPSLGLSPAGERERDREAPWIHSVSSSSCSAMTVVDAESRFHVLAVDDSLIDRKLIEMLLKTSSYQVTTVDSGSKALELLGLRDEGDDSSSPSSSSPDRQEIDVNLIITDYCMPGMTGYDLLKRVKGSTSLKDIPVVIMSSENVPARINRCLEDGAEEFFLKPVKLADMKKLKSHLLKRKQPKPQPQQQEQSPHKPEEAAAATAAAAEVTADGTITDRSSGNKRKAAAMEPEPSAERTKPRLSSSSSSSLAVET